MRTITTEAKLIKQLTTIHEAVLYEVFMDLQKAYNALDQDICFVILAACGVGPRELRIIRTY